MQNFNLAKKLDTDYDYSEIFFTILKKTDLITYGHSQRLIKPALKVGSKFNLEQKMLEKLVLLAKLHDIGKIIIPNKIKEKNGPLNQEEWLKIKKHPVTGFQLTYCSLDLIEVSEGILTHHEWWDGSGYPFGLEKEDIPLIARIISVVDAYDVMKYGRSYKKAMSKTEIIEEFKKASGVQFDPLVVKKILEFI